MVPVVIEVAGLGQTEEMAGKEEVPAGATSSIGPVQQEAVRAMS